MGSAPPPPLAPTVMWQSSSAAVLGAVRTVLKECDEGMAVRDVIVLYSEEGDPFPAETAVYSDASLERDLRVCVTPARMYIVLGVGT